MADALALAIEDLEARDMVLPIGAPAETVRISSGGIAEDEDAPVSLWLDRDGAATCWRRALWGYLRDRAKEIGGVSMHDLVIRWADEPSMFRFLTTMTDADNTHRVVQTRFAVMCVLWAGTREQSAKLPAARPVKTFGER